MNDNILNDNILNDNILNDPAVQRMINAPDFITKNIERDLSRLAFELEEDHPGEGIALVEEFIKERDELREKLKKAEENATSLGDKLSQAGDENRQLKALLDESIEYVEELIEHKEEGIYAIEALGEEERGDRHRIDSEIARCEKYLASVRAALGPVRGGE